MLDRLIHCLRGLVPLAAAATLLSSCGGSTQPTPVTPTDPPAISCPTAAMAQSVDGNPVPVTYADPTVTGGQTPLTVACTTVSGATFSVGTKTVSCTVTDAQKRTATCSFTVSVVVPAQPVISVTSFVAFGDSITWGEDGQNFSAQSLSRLRPAAQLPVVQTYPGALAQMLLGRYSTPSIHVDNAGQPGESVTGNGPVPSEPAPSRFSRTIAGGRYQVALIMEGANDLAQRDSKVDPAVIDGLRQMILDAKSRNMQALLATIPPENAAAPCCRALGWSLVAPFNDLVRGLASQQAVPLVDVYAALNGDVNTYIGPDGLHPTAAGYAKIADTFFGVIKQTLEVTATITPTRTGARVISGSAVAVPAPSNRAPQPVVRKLR
ncbi:MAG TPA: GDSL-type esterase/lipase family protein [Vicinamibacterales bacterium]|jgi:lysophospholipase L1-like esterase|nr:GDSL-type esterase/lipase family protein [Vicinamibacterales bacterium]